MSLQCIVWGDVELKSKLYRAWDFIAIKVTRLGFNTCTMYLLRLKHNCAFVNDLMVNWVLQPCYRKIKVSNEVCFMEIGITMATLKENSSFYIFSISIDCRIILGKCSCDLIVNIIVSSPSEYKQILWERFWDIFD